MGNKFNAKKVKIDEHIFDSKKEANRYLELKSLEARGKISNLELQKKYVLIPKQVLEYEEEDKKGRIKTKQMTLFRETSYVCDFYYINEDGEEVVEDVKGLKIGAAWQVYTLKKKMLYEKYGILIKEI